MTKLNRSDVSLINKETGYQGFFTINKYTLRHRLFNGEQSGIIKRECFERGHAVGVLAYDPWLDNIVLLEQFRIGAYANTEASADQSPWLVEIIAGIVELDEVQEEVAHREAFEEAGCSLIALEPIVNFYASPGGMTETTQLYCGCVNSEGLGGIHGLQEEGEDIRVMVVSYEQAVHWLTEGRLNNASAIIAMQWLMLNRNMLKAKWC